MAVISCKLKRQKWYLIYPKNSDTISTYHTCFKIYNNLLYLIFLCLKYCYIYVKQCRPWSDTIFCSIWSGSTLFDFSFTILLLLIIIIQKQKFITSNIFQFHFKECYFCFFFYFYLFIIFFYFVNMISLGNLSVVCVVVLRPSQPNGVMLSVVSLPYHSFTGQA